MSHLLRRSIVSLPLIAIAMLLLGVGGCTHAEFDILQPTELAQHVGTKEWATAPMGPIVYRMIAYEDHLVIEAHNHTDQSLMLLADQSTVVSPGGQSHPLPLRNQTILPNSFAKLILPPVRPQLVPTGPAINIGFGATYGSAYPYHYHGGRYYYPYGYGSYWYDVPRYYTVVGPDDASLFWSWPDGGQVRLVLVYLRPEPPPGTPVPVTAPTTEPSAAPPLPGRPEPITHEFVFRMKKV